MYRRSNEVIKFIRNAMENWKVELTKGGKTLAKVKIRRHIVHGDPLSSSLAMMPLNYLLRKCTGGKKFTKSQNVHG